MIKSMLAWCIPKSNVDVELLVVISMISKDQRVFNHFIVLTWGQEPIDCTSCAVESWTWQVRRMSADIPLVADDSEN